MKMAQPGHETWKPTKKEEGVSQIKIRETYQAICRQKQVNNVRVIVDTS